MGAKRKPDYNIAKIDGPKPGRGRNYKYMWIDRNRSGPTEENVYKEEEIIEVLYNPHTLAFTALVGSGSHQRYIIATDDMRIGGIIRSNNFIPEIPIRGKEGDSYAL